MRPGLRGRVSRGRMRLDFSRGRWHHRVCIKSGADALANLPNRARWFPQGDAAKLATNRVARVSALLGMPMEGFLLPRIGRGSSFIAFDEGLARLTGWGICSSLPPPAICRSG